jgi:hypothetical protein
LDQEWLKNLAGARGSGAALGPADPQAVERLAAARLDGAIHELYAEAQDCCLVFNEAARGARAVNHLPLRGDGFMLLMGRVQLILERKGAVMEARLVAVDGFIRQERPLHRFTAQVDAFGSLVWQMDNALLLNNELIIKRLFEDLARAALG